MKTLTEAECAQVGGAGAFSFLKGTGSALAFGTIGWFVGGPAGAAMGLAAWTVNNSTDFIYEMAVDDRDSYRVENYDAFGNRR